MSEKLERLLKAIQAITKDDDEDLAEELADYDDADKIIEYVNDFESKVAKLLREQKKYFKDGIETFVGTIEKSNVNIQKDGETISELIMYLKQSLFAADEFAKNLKLETIDMLNLTAGEITKLVMDAIDKDVTFEAFSGQTIKWIEEWSEELGELMQITSHNAVEKILSDTLITGDSIQDAVIKLNDLPEFNRIRARSTAITEVLTAHSVSMNEAFIQSPAVVGKKWKHSGTKKNNAREEHVALDGTIIGLDEKFDVGGESADYPRDPVLSAKQRVNCHCTMGPDIDQDIIKLSVKEKNELRAQALADME